MKNWPQMAADDADRTRIRKRKLAADGRRKTQNRGRGLAADGG